MRSLLIIASGIIAVVLLFVFPVGEQFGIAEIYPRTAGVCAVVMIFPALLALEMFSKGNEAGQRLKDELDTALDTLGADDSRLISDLVGRCQAAIQLFRRALQETNSKSDQEDAERQSAKLISEIEECFKSSNPRKYAKILSAKNCASPMRIGTYRCETAGKLQAIVDALAD